MHGSPHQQSLQAASAPVSKLAYVFISALHSPRTPGQRAEKYVFPFSGQMDSGGVSAGWKRGESGAVRASGPSPKPFHSFQHQSQGGFNFVLSFLAKVNLE